MEKSHKIIASRKKLEKLLESIGFSCDKQGIEKLKKAFDNNLEIIITED